MELDDGEFIYSYLLGLVKSWFYWPIIASFTFNYKYAKQKRKFEEENPGQIALAWPVVQVSVRQEGVDSSGGIHYIAPANEEIRRPGANRWKYGSMLTLIRLKYDRIEVTIFRVYQAPTKLQRSGLGTTDR